MRGDAPVMDGGVLSVDPAAETMLDISIPIPSNPVTESSRLRRGVRVVTNL
jgi:hypothetical protein